MTTVKLLSENELPYRLRKTFS